MSGFCEYNNTGEKSDMIIILAFIAIICISLLIVYTRFNKYPRTEPPSTIRALLTFFNPNTAARLTTAMVMVRQSVMVSLPIW